MVKAVGLWLIALVLSLTGERGALSASQRPAAVKGQAAQVVGELHSSAQVTLLSQQPKANCGSRNVSWIKDYAQWHQQQSRMEDAKWVWCGVVSVCEIHHQCPSANEHLSVTSLHDESS